MSAPAPWAQDYTPLGTVGASALAAALPAAALLGLLAFGRVRADRAALAGLLAALLVAVFVFGMPPALAAAAAAHGAAYGLFPVGCIVLGALFVYDVTVATGQFDVLRRAVAGMADDRRLQALLIAFAFGAFVEGAAGFGTPVAVSSAMLIGLGFRPVAAAAVSLVGNTAPVAFGSLGTPVLALSRVTGLPVEALSAMVGRQLPPFSLLVPFWIVWAMAGRRATWEVWVVPAPRAEEAVFVFNWLSATGTALVVAGVAAGLALGVRPGRLAAIFGGTLRRVRRSLVTIAAMLALGYTTRYGGLDTTMGLAFAGTGWLFPFFSPLLGRLGVALTGSDTASNVLFGNLQQVTAERVGVSPVLAAAANSSGGVMGKMIDAQSIVVAGAATGRQGGEGAILRRVFPHSLALAVLVGLLVLAQAYLAPGVVPGAAPPAAPNGTQAAGR